MKKVLFLPLLVLLACCTQGIDNPEDLPIARVHDEYLYVSDLSNIIPKNLTEIDSLALVKDYIEKWVQKQLILTQAEANLTEEEKNVEKQINDYRTSLLIFKYEQNLIQQKLDTVITQEEINEYYTKNSSNFILNENLTKGIYLKIPRSAPDIWKVRRWYKSDNEDHIKELDAYCFQNAEEVDYFDNDWVVFSEIIEKMPNLYNTPSNILKTRPNIEVRNDDYYFFVRITEYKLEGTTAPIEYVSNNIKSILLNKRKINYINKLEADIYNNALNREQFNIY